MWGWHKADISAAIGHEAVTHNFRLLLNAIAGERQVLTQFIRVATERVAREQQEISPPSLRLPDMSHFVDEQALRPQRFS